MQASIVRAFMPITTTVPVTLVVLSDPEHQKEPKTFSKSRGTRRVPQQETSIEPTVAKILPQPKPRSVTVKAKSLLKHAKNMQRHRNSLLKSRITSQNEKSLLKPVIVPPDKSQVSTEITRQNEGSLLKPVIQPQNQRSLLKPLISPQGRDPTNNEQKTSREQPEMEIPSTELLDNFENGPKRMVIVRPAKSLLKSAMPQDKHPSVDTSSDGKPTRARRKVFARNVTLEDFKTTQRAKRSLAILKTILKASKEKLHFRHRQVSSSVRKVAELKKLLVDLKSRKVITEEAHSRLNKAVNCTLTVLKNNFQIDPTA